MEFCTNQWTGLYMIGISVMKELTKWLEKSLWVINIKFYDVIVTDMFHRYRIRSPKVFL